MERKKKEQALPQVRQGLFLFKKKSRRCVPYDLMSCKRRHHQLF